MDFKKLQRCTGMNCWTFVLPFWLDNSQDNIMDFFGQIMFGQCSSISGLSRSESFRYLPG